MTKTLVNLCCVPAQVKKIVSKINTPCLAKMKSLPIASFPIASSCNKDRQRKTQHRDTCKSLAGRSLLGRITKVSLFVNHWSVCNWRICYVYEIPCSPFQLHANHQLLILDPLNPLFVDASLSQAYSSSVQQIKKTKKTNKFEGFLSVIVALIYTPKIPICFFHTNNFRAQVLFH